MPKFYEYVDVDIEIDVDEFLSRCNSKDIKELIEALIEDKHIPSSMINKGKHTIAEWEFNNIINKIASNRLQLTNEEDELLKKIASRF